MNESSLKMLRNDSESANEMSFNQRTLNINGSSPNDNILNNGKNGLAQGKVLNINNSSKENNVIDASAFNSNSSLMTR